VTNISRHGFWLLIDNRELFLSYDEFPWFRNAPVASIFHVEFPHADHLYWPELDVDLAVASIEQPDRYPLMAKERRQGAED
jgi:hypothetical protein